VTVPFWTDGSIRETVAIPHPVRVSTVAFCPIVTSFACVSAILISLSIFSGSATRAMFVPGVRADHFTGTSCSTPSIPARNVQRVKLALLQLYKAPSAAQRAIPEPAGGLQWNLPPLGSVHSPVACEFPVVLLSPGQFCGDVRSIPSAWSFHPLRAGSLPVRSRCEAPLDCFLSHQFAIHLNSEVWLIGLGPFELILASSASR